MSFVDYYNSIGKRLTNKLVSDSCFCRTESNDTCCWTLCTRKIRTLRITAWTACSSILRDSMVTRSYSVVYVAPQRAVAMRDTYCAFLRQQSPLIALSGRRPSIWLLTWWRDTFRQLQRLYVLPTPTCTNNPLYPVPGDIYVLLIVGVSKCFRPPL
jgi:hypothetical protein